MAVKTESFSLIRKFFWRSFQVRPGSTKTSKGDAMDTAEAAPVTDE